MLGGAVVHVRKACVCQRVVFIHGIVQLLLVIHGHCTHICCMYTEF